MEIYTKLFWANWVLFLFIAGMDLHIFDNKLGKSFSAYLGAWAIFTLSSVPAIIIYWIMS